MGYSPGPVVLGLLTTGKGNGSTTPFTGCSVGWVMGTHMSLGLICCPLFCKVWTAWLGFVLEKRRKKARLERAMQAYHQRLLREGATRLLRFAAGMKGSRQQLQARQQLQVSQGCWWELAGQHRAGADEKLCCRRPTACTVQSATVPSSGKKRPLVQAGCVSQQQLSRSAGE